MSPPAAAELTSKVHRGNCMASRQHHKLRGACKEERIGRNQKRIGGIACIAEQREHTKSVNLRARLEYVKMTSRSTNKGLAGKRAAIIDKMISSLRRGGGHRYFVGLVGYYIEGVPYSASGLSVDSGATQDIQRTENGFSCTAMFPPELLEPDTVKTNGTIKIKVGGRIREVVRVQLEAKLEDIWSVAELINDTPHNLFFDPKTAEKRLRQFSL
jgi:hypothetical protein